MSLITDIRRSGPGFRRRTLVVDGDPWRDIPRIIADQLGVEVGDEVELPDLESRIAEAEVPRAREKAIALLTARERSHAGLVARLVDSGFSDEVSRATATDLERIGLVDDERFARSFARTLAHARGVGRSRIARELRDAGVSESIARDALEEALPVDDELDAARVIARAAASRRGATVDRIASKLARRGYRLPVALTVAREAIEEFSVEGDSAPDDVADLEP